MFHQYHINKGTPLAMIALTFHHSYAMLCSIYLLKTQIKQQSVLKRPKRHSLKDK